MGLGSMLDVDVQTGTTLVVSPMPFSVAGGRVEREPLERRVARVRREGRVRLDDVEATALIAALDDIAADGVELFGSRTDPSARGGDIDVIIWSTAEPLELSRHVSCRFFSRCEERIDVVVMNPTTLTPAQEAFLSGLHRVPLS